jgi:hypothetical protein
VVTVPVELLTKPGQRVSPRAATWVEGDATQRAAKRVRRLKLNVAAWALGTILLTAAWISHEWQANGAFERIAHEGNPGDWNPTLWALAVLLWGLVVGIMALRVRFESRLRFHVAAWVLGLIVLTPLNALIEWQDNGGFERFSSNSQPGSWDPWVLYIAGTWALVIAVLVALPVLVERRRTEARSST